MVEILLKIGEFNENCQRPIYCAETIELNLEIAFLVFRSFGLKMHNDCDMILSSFFDTIYSRKNHVTNPILNSQKKFLKYSIS